MFTFALSTTLHNTPANVYILSRNVSKKGNGGLSYSTKSLPFFRLRQFASSFAFLRSASSNVKFKKGPIKKWRDGNCSYKGKKRNEFG